ncbi:hypothetical protein AVEN_269338-1, partial [Araneus ventricosus]
MEEKMFTLYLAWYNKELQKCAHLIHCLSPLSGVESSQSARFGILKRSVVAQLNGARWGLSAPCGASKGEAKPDMQGKNFITKNGNGTL